MFNWKLFTVLTCCLSILSFTTQAAPQRDYKIQYQTQVKQIFTDLNPQNMWTDLTRLTQFPDRYAHHQSGVDAANWIKAQAENIIKLSGRQDARVFTVATNGKDENGFPYKSDEYSIILKVGTSNQPGIVVGAHFDTLGCTKPYGGGDDEGCKVDPYGPLPGADDDGSGTVTVMELARTLLNSHMTFKRPIYFIWYAAEESGEIGSQVVVNDFLKKDIPVYAIMQLDQTGFAYKNNQTVYIETNKNRKYQLVDNALTTYLFKLGQTYLTVPVKLNCSGSSDEESWTQIGKIPAARALEADYCDYDKMNQNVHSMDDTMESISLAHMTNFLKLSAAFTVELAEPI